MIGFFFLWFYKTYVFPLKMDFFVIMKQNPKTERKMNMHFEFLKDEVLLKRIQETHLKNNVREVESDMSYRLDDWDIIDTLGAVEEHDEWNIHPEKSVRVFGLAGEEEIEKIKELERKRSLKILNMQSDSYPYLDEDANTILNTEPHMYWTSILLHVDETERYLQENIIQFLEKEEMKKNPKSEREIIMTNPFVDERKRLLEISQIVSQDILPRLDETFETLRNLKRDVVEDMEHTDERSPYYHPLGELYHDIEQLMGYLRPIYESNHQNQLGKYENALQQTIEEK